MIVGSKFPPNRVGFSNFVFGGFLLVGTADFGIFEEYLKKKTYSPLKPNPRSVLFLSDLAPSVHSMDWQKI